MEKPEKESRFPLLTEGEIGLAVEATGTLRKDLVKRIEDARQKLTTLENDFEQAKLVVDAVMVPPMPTDTDENRLAKARTRQTANALKVQLEKKIAQQREAVNELELLLALFDSVSKSTNKPESQKS